MANRVPQNLTLNTSNHSKKQGVSAESSEAAGEAVNISIMKYDKDFRLVLFCIITLTEFQ